MPRQHPVSEGMEPRILHSADAAPLLLAGAGDAGQLQQPVQLTTSATTNTHARSELVFVDAQLPDSASLLADLQAQRSAGRMVDIVMIGADQDGLALIGATLAGRHDVAAVHVLTHGSDGALQLGSTTLDAQTVMQRAGELAAWSRAFTADADLLLYGCELARTESGQRLVADIAALTGADVAASTDTTGAARLGGDWALEFNRGVIDTALAPSLAEQAIWQGQMATYSVTSTSDLFLALIPVSGTFRWAVGQANSNPGTDTINFTVNGTFSINSLGSGGDDNQAGDFDVKDSVNIVGNGTGNTIITGDSNDRALDLISGTINISGLTVQGGHASTGGGINARAGTNVTLNDVVVQNNFGNGISQGAGIFAAGELTLRNVLVQNNGNGSDPTDGAGIYVVGGATLDARNVEIRGNDSDSKRGGGVSIQSGGSATLVNVTVANNRANQGGGIVNSGSLSLFNSTLSGNTANSQGGGLRTTTPVSLNHVTIAGNSANSGGGVSDADGEVSMQNSLFAGNSGGNTNLALVSLGYNLSDDASPGFNGTGDLSNTPAGLSALANNGGFTRTHAISLASAARDTANPAVSSGTDQRGQSYFGGRADVGAYELNPSGASPTVSSVGNQTIAEDGAVGPIAFSVGDAETAAGSIVVTATSSNTALVPDGNIVIGGSGANRSVSIMPADNANSTANGGPATITLSVSDGGNVVTTTFNITVTAVNDAPSVSLPVAQAVNEDGTLTLAGGNAPVVSDVDAGTASVQLTLAVTHGLLTLSQTTGLSFVSGTGSGNASMTFNGTLGAINAALAGMQYRPSANYNGPDTLGFNLNDLGNSGDGGALVATGNLGITVTAANDAPLLGLPGTQATELLTPLLFSSATGNAIILSDVDAVGGTVELTLSTLATGNGKLSFVSLAGVTLVSGSGSADTTVVLRGSIANLNNVLETLRFDASTEGPASISVSVDDLGNSGTPATPMTTSGSISITVASGALPVLTLTQTSLSFTENDAPAALDGALTVTDADNATLSSARIAFSAGYAGVQDELRFTNSAGMGNITGSYNAGVLSLSSAGATAATAQWQTALRSVTYINTSEAPDTTLRTLSLTVNDGLADSAARSYTINVAARNDAPVLMGANDLASILEDAGNNAGTLVSTLIAGQVSDVDAGAVPGIAVTSVDDSQGVWQYTLDGGGNWNAFGSVSDSAARLLGVDANTAVRFVPAADSNGSVAGGLRFRAWDQSSGAAGALADASVNGADSAFSSASASSSIVVTAVNDAPVLAGANNLAGIAEDASGNTGTLVSAIIAGQVRDPDAVPLGGVAVVGVDNSNGNWQFSLDSGASWMDFGSASDASARLLAADAATRVRLVPDSNWSGSFATGLTLRAWDQTSGTAGQLADAGNHGADTAFSDATAAAGIDVSPVNDAPVLFNSIADQGATQGLAFRFQVPDDSFSDVDFGDTLAYSATLSGGGALPAWLSFNAASRTFSGTPANADVGSITLRVTVTDGAGASAYDDFDLVVANANDAPTVAIPIADQAATQGSPFSFSFAAGTFTDIDVGDSLGYSATLSGGGALPAWLNFNAATRSFSGTPATADVGSITVRVLATDGASASVFDDFLITVADLNDGPTVGAPIPDQLATQGSLFNFTFGAGTFTDIDVGDTLGYSATLSGGGALPAWLNFNADTRSFSGTPANADVGSIAVRVRATDSGNASAVADFTLSVANINDAPVLARTIDTQDALADRQFLFDMPPATFVDPDVGDTLSYSASLADGTALPAWLVFDGGSLRFTGNPTLANLGEVVVRVTATDGSGLQAQGLFVVSVATAPPADLVAALGAAQPSLPPVTATPPVPRPVAEPPSKSVAQVESATLPAAVPDVPVTNVTVESAALAEAPRRDEADSSSALRVVARSDMNLGELATPQFSDISPSQLSQVARSDEFSRKVEEMQRQMQRQSDVRNQAIASSVLLTGSVSIGYVIWLVRGGVLVSSMLSALPAWQMIDPLPVLAAARTARDKRATGDDVDVERLFDEPAPAGDRKA